MQTIIEPTSKFTKKEQNKVRLNIGESSVKIAPNKQFKNFNLAFSLIKDSQVDKIKKFIIKFSIKTYSITICILPPCQHFKP